MSALANLDTELVSMLHEMVLSGQRDAQAAFKEREKSVKATTELIKSVQGCLAALYAENTALKAALLTEQSHVRELTAAHNSEIGSLRAENAALAARITALESRVQLFANRIVDAVAFTKRFKELSESVERFLVAEQKYSNEHVRFQK